MSDSISSTSITYAGWCVLSGVLPNFYIERFEQPICLYCEPGGNQVLLYDSLACSQ